MIKSNNPQSDMLYDAILALRTVDECKAFFQDLCTVAELRAIMLAEHCRPTDRIHLLSEA